MRGAHSCFCVLANQRLWKNVRSERSFSLEILQNQFVTSLLQCYRPPHSRWLYTCATIPFLSSSITVFPLLSLGFWRQMMDYLSSFSPWSPTVSTFDFQFSIQLSPLPPFSHLRALSRYFKITFSHCLCIISSHLTPGSLSPLSSTWYWTWTDDTQYSHSSSVGSTSFQSCPITPGLIIGYCISPSRAVVLV